MGLATLLLLGCLSAMVQGEAAASTRRLQAKLRWLFSHVSVDPEVFMDSTQLITSKGYPCENHYITTQDGFILNMQRIPHGRNSQPTPGVERPVVILQHGLEASSSNWLDNLVNESLAYLLADGGADVWLGNVRGNMYSKNHTSLKPDQKEFWEWSWDEMAAYDLPAMIEHVVRTTGVKKVHYAGHSQGSLIGFAGFSSNHTLAAMVKRFYALAPVAKVRHIRSPIRLFAPFAHDLPTRIPVYVGHNPGGTSVQNVLHFAQGVNVDACQKFDYGSADANLAHYNQSTPPHYNLADFHVPVVTYTGGHDLLADPTDVAWLLQQIAPSLLVNHNVPSWEHLDFIWAFDAPKYCYNDILDWVFRK